MSDIQSGLLGEFTSQITGGGTPSREVSEFWNGGIPWVSVKDLASSNPESSAEKISEQGLASSASRLIPAGIPIVATRMAVGRSAVFASDVAINQDLKAIFPNEELLEKRYLFHFLRANESKLASKGTGSTVKGIRLEDLEQLPILVPPLPEQKKIAEILSGIDTTIAQLKLKAQKLDALHFSLAEALSEVLHRDGKPSALQEFAEIRTGIAKNSSDEGDMAELPYMRVANVQDGYLDLSEIKTINVDKSRVARYLLQKGDVLINEGGDLDKVGRGVIWHGEIRECLHQNHVFAVRCSERLMPEFLSLLLKTSYSKNFFLGCAKQTTNLASINSTQLKSFPIPLPSLSAQKEFVNQISSIKQSTSSVSSKISSLAAMKNAISSDLLSGRKRVTL